MPASLLGLMLLACPQHCELPLPGSVLEVRVQATQWQWCLRGDGPERWRLCEEDLLDALRAPLHSALQGLADRPLPRHRHGRGEDRYIS